MTIGAVVLAASIAIGWTSHGGTSYIWQRSWTHGATWESRPVWKDSAMTIPLMPAPDGTIERAFTWTDAPSRNDFVAQLVACKTDTCSAPSNRLVVSTGLVPGATYFLGRGAGVWTDPKTADASGTIGWALASGDSADWSVVTQKAAQDSCTSVVCGWRPQWRTAVVCPP